MTQSLNRLRHNLNVAAYLQASDHQWRGLFANSRMRHDMGTLLPWEKPAMEAADRHNKDTGSDGQRRAYYYDRAKAARGEN